MGTGPDLGLPTMPWKVICGPSVIQIADSRIANWMERGTGLSAIRDFVIHNLFPGLG